MIKHFLSALQVSSVFVFTLPLQAQAGPQASFDCAKAQSRIEKIICSNNTLAWQDRRLGELYAMVKGSLPNAEKDALLQAQRKWLAGHDQACPATGAETAEPMPDEHEADAPADSRLEEAKPAGAAACLAQRYQARIAELQAQLSRGNVIRELADDPWASARRSRLLRTCEQTDPNGAAELDTGGGPGGYFLSEGDSRHTAFLVDGRRYVLFSGEFDLTMQAPRSLYETQEYQDNPPDLTDRNFCTLVLSEKTPGAGDFAEVAYRESGILKLPDFLTGRPKPPAPNNGFALALHGKFPGGEITLIATKGASRHFKWSAATNWYVESR